MKIFALNTDNTVEVMKNNKISNFLKYIELFFLVVVILWGIKIRLQHFDEQSKDIYAYEKAIYDFRVGANPYTWTVKSYNQDDPSEHGFAYLPTMLYVNACLKFLGYFFDIHFKYLWKMPVLLADLGIAVFILKRLKDEKPFIKTVAVAMWLLNPYAYFRGGYTYFDPLPVFFMLLALEKLEKNSYLSGSFYALAISLKTFPYILFPVFILKLLPKTLGQVKTGVCIFKSEISKFLIAGILLAIIISIPFMRSFDDFITYLNGTIFVHSNRYIQGRPFLFYISYFYKIELFQIIPFKIYTLLASFGGWIPVALAYYKYKVKNVYVLSLIPFLCFYLFTPVLNRTYLIWFIPIFVLAINKIFENKKAWFYIISLFFYVFYSWYLLQWEDGFHIWHP